jgi:hypothetical protein
VAGSGEEGLTPEEVTIKLNAHPSTVFSSGVVRFDGRFVRQVKLSGRRPKADGSRD